MQLSGTVTVVPPGGGVGGDGGIPMSIDVSPSAVRPPTPNTSATSTGELVVVCRGMAAADVANLLLGCRPLPERKALYTVRTLPVERTQALRDSMRDNAPLPEGVFYDGREYIDMDGNRSENHPDMEVGLQRLLTELNTSVNGENEAADAAMAQAKAEAARYINALA